jgi:hypothetical protein
MATNGGPNIIEDGLVFTVDAANKKSYPGSGTTWKDLSGNGNEIELINGPTFDSGNGGSVVFDGTNDFARDITYNGPSMTLNGPLTLSGWFNYDSYGSTRSTLGLINGNNAVQMGFRGGQGANWKYGGTVLVNHSIPTVGTWFNSTLTLNGSIAISYVNGELDTTNLSASPQTVALASIVMSSYTTGGSSERFVGKISGVSLYNRILSPSEVTQNYNALKGRFGL